MEIMRNSQFLHSFSLLFLLLCPVSASSGSVYDYGGQQRFICTPIPLDSGPACFSAASPGTRASGPSGAGHQSVPPAGWGGVSEEAKATILHLRESLVQQKETILDQRETIRELTAKLALCEGIGHHATPPTESQHGGGEGGHNTSTDNGQSTDQHGHHGNHNPTPDPPHQPHAGGHGSNDHGKDKPVTPGDTSSSPEQLERMLQAMKDRLDNLQQKRNLSITYSSSLKELLQRKIDTLEQQLQQHRQDGGHHHNDDHRGDGGHRHDDDHRGDGGHHHDDEDHRGDGGHHHDDDDHRGDGGHHHDDDDHRGDGGHHHDDGHHDDGHSNDHMDDHNDGGHGDGGNHTDRHEDGHEDDHHDRDGDHDGHHDDHRHDDHHSNEAESHGYRPHTGHRAPVQRARSNANKLETMLSQLAGFSRKQPQSHDDFQISFPMRTNYMYGRVKRTLLQEIFALTLCLWIKAGVGPGVGTPFSYSAPGQPNELVLIEWGNNPMELLIDDKAVTLPLSLSDEKWHHVCVTWTTRDGHWEAYQDGLQKGSGINLSPWHPIKPGGVFILGQEQDTLGGRFDATQSFVGEMSDLHMWSHVLTANDIYSLASCSSHLRGDVIDWSETELELHGGVATYPFDSCH